MANKIKFGLKNVYYAIATIAADGSATYSTPVAFPGAVSLSLAPQGDTTRFFADNIVYWAGVANSGYEGDFEVARVIDSFKTDVLGYKADNDGVIVEDANAEAVHFALMFQFEGDVEATRHVMYNCTAARPTVAGSTKEESIEPETETLTFTAATIYSSALDTDVTKAECTKTQSATAYAAWFENVHTPTAEG